MLNKHKTKKNSEFLSFFRYTFYFFLRSEWYIEIQNTEMQITLCCCGLWVCLCFVSSFRFLFSLNRDEFEQAKCMPSIIYSKYNFIYLQHKSSFQWKFFCVFISFRFIFFFHSCHIFHFETYRRELNFIAISFVRESVSLYLQFFSFSIWILFVRCSIELQ